MQLDTDKAISKGCAAPNYHSLATASHIYCKALSIELQHVQSCENHTHVNYFDVRQQCQEGSIQYVSVQYNVVQYGIR
eukprot:13530-Heterococcus_DN1.PRE.4